MQNYIELFLIQICTLQYFITQQLTISLYRLSLILKLERKPFLNMFAVFHMLCVQFMFCNSNYIIILSKLL